MRFHWISGDTFALELGGFRLVADPLAAEAEEARRALLVEPQVRVPDWFLVSRLAPEHHDSAAQRRSDKATPVIAPPAHIAALAALGFRSITGLGWWSEVRVGRGSESLAVTAVPTRRAVGDAGEGNGYLVEHSVGDAVFSVYWPGETVWFDGLSEIRDYVVETDLLILQLGGAEGTRVAPGPEDAARIVTLFRPESVIPFGASRDGDDLGRVQYALRRAGYAGQIVVPELGAALER